MADDLDGSASDVRVSIDEVSCEDGSEELGRVDRVFFGLNVDCVLHGVSSYDHAVVCCGVSARY